MYERPGPINCDWLIRFLSIKKRIKDFKNYEKDIEKFIEKDLYLQNLNPIDTL